MAVKQYVLTLTGVAQALSVAIDATTRPIRTVSLQPNPSNTHPIYIGDANVSASVYGIRLPAPVSSEPPAPFLVSETQGPFGHYKLSDVYVIGTNAEKVHLLVFTI